MRKGKIKSIILAMSLMLGIAGATPVLAARSAYHFFYSDLYGISAYADLTDGGILKQDKMSAHAMIVGNGTGAEAAVAYYKLTRREETWFTKETVTISSGTLKGYKSSSKSKVWSNKKIGYFNTAVTMKVSSNGEAITAKD